jgi:hypothetical protein
MYLLLSVNCVLGGEMNGNATDQKISWEISLWVFSDVGTWMIYDLPGSKVRSDLRVNWFQ